MVNAKSVEEQLKNIKFSSKSWGRAEIGELPSILMDDEKIFECVNGTYEGGFALLVATNIRLLLVDKKPLKFLTVEDLRFDMINQIDYSHRLMGARINVSAGNKNLKFTSFNQQRLRKLINHIQHRMAEVKKELTSSSETQQQHLERINQQLQAYLLAQHQQQEELRHKLEIAEQKGQQLPIAPTAMNPVRPAPELADFLYAQSLLQHHQDAVAPPMENQPPVTAAVDATPAVVTAELPAPVPTESATEDSLVEAGRREIFGAKARAVVKPLQAPLSYLAGMEVNPLKVAYAKLPTLLRHRKANATLKLTKPSILPAATIRGNGPTQIAGA